MVVMELTKEEITQIISTGRSEQSPVAAEYISEAKKRYDVDIVACYSDTSQVMYFSGKSIPTKEIDPQDTQLVNSLNLTVYLRNRVRDIDAVRSKHGNNLLLLFEEIVASNNVDIEYARTFSPAEIEYYGWQNKRYAEWDMSKIIRPTKPIVEKKRISAESFNDLALWHYMSRGIKRINSFKSTSELTAKVYYGWDMKGNRPAFYIILPKTMNPNDYKTQKEQLNNEISAHMHAVDKFGDVCDNYSLIYTHWSALPEKIRFSLLRG